jgi:hypothetical protein
MQATGVIVTDDLPVGMLYNGSNADFTLNFGTINIAETVSQTISVTIDAAFTGTTLTNYVEITADNGDDNDSTTNNQSDDEDDDDTAVVSLTTNAVCGNGIPEAGEECGEPTLTCGAGSTCNDNCQCG